MKYSNSTIEKAGKTLFNSKSEVDVANAEKIIEDWRCQHDYVLNELEKNIIPFLQSYGIGILDIGRRLKRMSAIKNKMDKHNVWNLSTMQDIGGMRIVLLSLDVLMQVKTLLSEHAITDFVVNQNCIYDYVNNPRNTGYRSIHVVYKYMPKEKSNDYYGQKVELQLRTRMQHFWAMGVETAELITGKALKNGEGDENWLTFFKNVSLLFAEVENNSEILKSIHATKKFFVNPKCIEELRSLMASVSYFNSEKVHDGYYLLNIDYKQRLSQIWLFPKEKQKFAIKKYNTIEHENKGTSKDVVLVSVPEMKNLRDMYPSYYLDASDFINCIHEFVDIKTGLLKNAN